MFGSRYLHRSHQFETNFSTQGTEQAPKRRLRYRTDHPHTQPTPSVRKPPNTSKPRTTQAQVLAELRIVKDCKLHSRPHWLQQRASSLGFQLQGSVPRGLAGLGGFQSPTPPKAVHCQVNSSFPNFKFRSRSEFAASGLLCYGNRHA